MSKTALSVSADFGRFRQEIGLSRQKVSDFKRQLLLAETHGQPKLLDELIEGKEERPASPDVRYAVHFTSLEPAVSGAVKRSSAGQRGSWRFTSSIFCTFGL